MKVLMIVADPQPTAFSMALHRAGVAALQAQGHEVRQSDLYAMGFSAVAGPADVTERFDPDHFRLDTEQLYAHEHGTVAPDIVAEQEKVAWAEVVVLVYPMWWFMPPAILKGWVDRVFTQGFGYLSGRSYDTGMLRGKTAMVTVTTGTSADTYAADGIHGPMHGVLWPVQNGILRYVGFDVLEPFVVHAPGAMSDEQRAAVIDDYVAALGALDERPRLFFHPHTDYDDRDRLLPHVEPRSGFQYRP